MLTGLSILIANAIMSGPVTTLGIALAFVAPFFVNPRKASTANFKAVALAYAIPILQLAVTIIWKLTASDRHGWGSIEAGIRAFLAIALLAVSTTFIGITWFTKRLWYRQRSSGGRSIGASNVHPR
jgi:hypothetical protein